MTFVRSLLLSGAAMALIAPAWSQTEEAQPLPLSEISDYLNDLRLARSPFTQINDDGSVTTGTLYMNRPGRMRFAYDEPEDTVVIAGGSAVAIFDPKSNQGPQTYPLDRTPLSLILAEDVDLSRNGMVVGHERRGPATVVTAQDPEHPEYGNIELVFSHEPVELRQWVINDDSGSSTTVSLGALSEPEELDASLFSIQVEQSRRERTR
ncbi:MAG: outer membrane lipoprotein carrier protein LolA [Sediminimonas qiaohouensis]|uniref:Outer membrane lipoprotein carrier protein LolA n=1 Tax=Sediminimonas qiaohouensis TaxID=552061 RepID=A0A7C9HBQ3_9RHOB|nr:outer membrane lipoprotein carrier protein LolA [Sediminimonas qiaohouensis]MTJ05330.1 outer membrane lipoprotein carrier protein LolA [Sediminimonas qiaohouensis]